MGLNISLYRLPDEVEIGRQHWDWTRHAGDRDLFTWTSGSASVWRGSDHEFFRPANFAEWRAALPEGRPNPDRFPKMFDLLETDPNLWVYAG